MKKIFISLLLVLLISGCTTTTPGDGKKTTDEPNNNEGSTYTVIFDSNGGSDVASIEVEEDSYIALPLAPSKSGYRFDGWYKDAALTDKFNAGSTIQSNMTLYAKWVEDDEVIDDVVITFVTEHGNPPSSITGEPGSTITKPTDPTDDYYLFVNWIVQGTSTVFDWSNGMPEEDITLVAQWEEPATYQVIFHTDSDDVIDPYILEANDSVTLPTNLERQGYVFDGWYTDGSYQTKQEDSFDMPDNDLHLYAKWISYEDYYYTVSFEDTGDVYIEPLSQVKGTPITQPETPMKNGYLFDGWYTDTTYNTLFDFTIGYNQDQLVYAKWSDDPSTFEISFETNGGSAVDSIFIEANTSVRIPKTTLKDGHMLLGWYLDEAFTQTVFSTLQVTKDTVLYAKWHEQENVVYIFFDSMGGSDVDPYQKRPGQGIGAPAEPTKPGYDFIGWYEDEAYTRRYYFMSMGNETITLYAKWQKIDLQNDEVTTSLETTLSGWGFVCVEHVCDYEVSTGYNYSFNFNTNVFSYHKASQESNETGYRNYTSVITIDEDWNVTYTYHVEEDFGYYFETDVALSGNYQTETYTIDSFESNIQSEEARKEAAIESIEYFAAFVQTVLDAANLSMEDLG